MASMDELLDRAFQLAHFIHRDEEVAKCIALKAAETLDAALLKDDKRRYYLLRRNSRSKVSLGELARLQCLVFVESEQYERHREQEGQASGQPLNQETMIVHFVKHLVRITVRRKSLYVTLGISRLLHNYSTADTVELYGVVLQSADRVPDDDYFRACKATLMRELKERFGGLLNVTRGARGEERFVTHDNPSRFVTLVHECLRQFTPWGTRCVVPENFNAQTGELPELQFYGNDPDEEHPIEANRFHATLDPVCFDRLVKSLGREAPEKRLEIPMFAFGQVEDGDAGRGPAAMSENLPPTLSHKDRRLMTQHLERQSRRRKNSMGGTLRVLVDGEECARLDGERNDQTRFDISDGAELIEVRATDTQGELLLAAHMLEYEILRNALKPQQVEFAPEGGQRLALTITPTGEAAGSVEIRYFVPSYSLLSRFKSWFWPSGDGNWLKPVLVYALLLIAAGLLFNRLARKEGGNEIVVVVPSPSPSVTVTPTPVEQPSPLLSPSPPAPEEFLAVDLRASKSSGLENLTRSQREENAVSSLLAAKKLFIEAKGSSVATQFGELLKQRLQSKVKFVFTESSNDAEIALKLTVKPSDQRIVVEASIVNANGEVFWPLTPGFRARQYTGNQEKIIAQMSLDLLSDIQQLEQKQK